MELVRWVCDTSVFITRDHCGSGWTQSLIAINRVANFLIFLSYVSIPISLFYSWMKLRGLRPDWFLGSIARRAILLNFVFFILLCGLTHICDVLVFEWSPYRLFTLIDILTALASVPTAIVLPGVVRAIISGGPDE